MITMPNGFPMRGKSILNGNSNQEIHTFSIQTGFVQTSNSNNHESLNSFVTSLASNSSQLAIPTVSGQNELVNYRQPATVASKPTPVSSIQTVPTSTKSHVPKKKPRSKA